MCAGVRAGAGLAAPGAAAQAAAAARRQRGGPQQQAQQCSQHGNQAAAGGGRHSAAAIGSGGDARAAAAAPAAAALRCEGAAGTSACSPVPSSLLCSLCLLCLSSCMSWMIGSVFSCGSRLKKTRQWVITLSHSPLTGSRSKGNLGVCHHAGGPLEIFFLSLAGIFVYFIHLLYEGIKALLLSIGSMSFLI